MTKTETSVYLYSFINDWHLYNILCAGALDTSSLIQIFVYVLQQSFIVILI